METITGNFARVIGFVWCTKVQRVLIEIIYLFLSFDHKLDRGARQEPWARKREGDTI